MVVSPMASRACLPQVRRQLPAEELPPVARCGVLCVPAGWVRPDVAV